MDTSERLRTGLGMQHVWGIDNKQQCLHSAINTRKKQTGADRVAQRCRPLDEVREARVSLNSRPKR